MARLSLVWCLKFTHNARLKANRSGFYTGREGFVHGASEPRELRIRMQANKLETSSEVGGASSLLDRAMAKSHELQLCLNMSRVYRCLPNRE